MPQDVTCPGCGKKLKVPDSLAGKKGRCPACGAVLDIPGAAVQGLFPAGEKIGLPGAAEKQPPVTPPGEPPRPASTGLFPAGEKTGLPGQVEEKKEEPPPAPEQSPPPPEDSRAAARHPLAGATLKYARADSFVMGEESCPVLDISRKGVGFKLVLKPKARALQTVQLKPGVSPDDVLNLTIDIQAFVTTMKAKGRVTRVKRLDEKNAYLIGVEFTEMAPGEEERLRKLESSNELRQIKRSPKYI